MNREEGKLKCLNMYDVRLYDDSPACGMNWPPDLPEMYTYLRVSALSSVRPCLAEVNFARVAHLTHTHHTTVQPGTRDTNHSLTQRKDVVRAIHGWRSSNTPFQTHCLRCVSPPTYSRRFKMDMFPLCVSFTPSHLNTPPSPSKLSSSCLPNSTFMFP